MVMYNSFDSTLSVGTIVSSIALLTLSLNGPCNAHEIQGPLNRMHVGQITYKVSTGVDSSYSSFVEADDDLLLSDDLNDFWNSVEDGSVFELSQEASDHLDRILLKNPHVADGI